MAGDIDFGGGKAINVGDPRYSQDGVNLRTLLRIIELSGGGASSITGTVISISQGTNILTGGTVAKPTISTTLTPTFTSVYATTLSGGTIFSAGTNLSSLFINTNQRTFVQEGSNIYTGGTDYRPSIHINDSPSFNTIRASGTTYGNIVSGNTYYSGSTLLSNIIYSLASGSTFLPTTLIAFGSSTSGLTYDFGFSYNLSQNLFTIDGYTYVGKMASGVGGIQSTQNILGLYGFNSYSTIFLNSLGGVASDIQHFSTEGHYFSNGSHKSAFLNWSGVSLSYPALYMFDSITSITPNALNYTMASDGVNLYINSKNSGGRIQFAAGGTETGSINNGSAFFNSNVVSPVMSAYTMTSSTFVINTVAANYGAEYYNSGVKRWSLNVDGNDYFRLHPWNASPFGSNDIFFAGSALGVGGVPTHNLTVYGSARTHSLSATTISADTIYVSIISASTLSANTIQSSSLVGSTGRINSWTATTLSGGTIYSGSSDLSLLFMGAGAIPAIPLNKNEIAFGSNSNVITSNNTLKYINPNLFLTGNSNDELSLFVVNKSGTTSSVAAISLMNENDGAGKISKLSDLFTVVNTINPGDFLIYNSGSTGNINLLNANASGEIVMAAGGSVTNHFRIGTTGVLYSGGTDLDSVFAHAGKIGVTSIGSQNSNITTGGTVTNPTVLLAASPNLNGITLSGSGISARALSFSATTLSGGTLYSGSTNLYSIFQKLGSTTITGATNLGAAQEVFKATNGQLLEFRTLSGSNLNVRTDSDNIIIGSSNIKTTSSNSSIDIDFTDYVYNGGAGGATWTLPGTVPNNVKWKLLNIGAGNVTLNTGGGNDIYDMVGASTTNTASILQNEAYQIVANGTYFILIKLN
jgi:hypothetical protein